MNLLDANIFIYAPQPAFAHLRPMLIAPDTFASDITKLLLRIRTPVLSGFEVLP